MFLCELILLSMIESLLESVSGWDWISAADSVGLE